MNYPMLRTHEYGADASPELKLALFSDLHLCAVDIEEKRLKADLTRACDEGRRILVNGDLAELIIPGDRKRYTPSRAMSDRDDVLNEQTEYVYNFLKPFVDSIDMIGTGNHDESPIKYNSFDLVGAVVTLLNHDKSKTLSPIHRAGYQGYIRYKILDGKGHQCPFTIYHHHGAGGAAPVTKGMIDINRIVYSHDANLYWIGHKHVGTHDPYIVRDRINAAGNYENTVSQAVFTPGYKKPNTFTDYEKKGYKIDYSDKFYLMQATGYAVADVFVDRKNKKLKGFEVISR